MWEIIKKSSKDTEGFTLIELAVVIGIIAVLSAVIVPNMLSKMPERRLKSAARDMYSTLQKARLLAVKVNRVVWVTFDYGANPSFSIDVQEQLQSGDQQDTYKANEVKIFLSDYGGVSYGTASAVNDWDGDALSPPAKRIVFTKTGTMDISNTDIDKTTITNDDNRVADFPVNIYLDNEDNTICYAVSVEIYGSSRIQRYSAGSGWAQ